MKQKEPEPRTSCLWWCLQKKRRPGCSEYVHHRGWVIERDATENHLRSKYFSSVFLPTLSMNHPRPGWENVFISNAMPPSSSSVQVQGQGHIPASEGCCESGRLGRNAYGQKDSTCKDSQDISNKVFKIYGKLAAKPQAEKHGQRKLLEWNAKADETQFLGSSA